MPGMTDLVSILLDQKVSDLNSDLPELRLDSISYLGTLLSFVK